MNWIRTPLPLVVATALLIFAAKYPDSRVLESNLWPAFGYTAIYASSVYVIWPMSAFATTVPLRATIVCILSVLLTIASVWISSLIALSIGNPSNEQYRYLGNKDGTLIYRAK